MKFTKMQAYGNDYVYIETITQNIKNLNELSRFLSDRHYGVGGDGMILICPSNIADFRMRVFNPDGTEAEMCGNGIRSVGKYVYDKGFTTKTQFTVETLGGIKRIYLDVKDGKAVNITAEIGAPILEAKKVPVLCETEKCIDYPVRLGDKDFITTAISLGNPHCVTFIDDVDNFNLAKYGPLMENHKIFPRRVNAEFCEVVDKRTLKLRTWERGTGETLACATGCSTCVVGGVLTGRCERKSEVHQIGGVTLIEWNEKTDNIYMTAPSKIVFDGTVPLDSEVYGA
ncbi:MAG: diaminopimelate epimerase [Clostridiales bacterium]|nr:diaminopimelate epimerase [Clostridiales bacterium]